MPEDVKFNKLIKELIDTAMSQKYKTGSQASRRESMDRIIKQYLTNQKEQSE